MFDEFFRDEFRKVVRALEFTGATTHDAEKAAENAMTEAYLSWPLLEKPAAWVRVVAIHGYLDSAQRNRRRPILEAQTSQRACAEGHSPDSAEQVDEREQVLVAVGRLSSAQREVMALHMDGYHPAKIAELLGRPDDTVRSNLRHARDRLRRDLESRV